MCRIAFIKFLSLGFLLSCFSISDAYEKEIKALSSTLAQSIVTSGKKSIAVVDFTDLQGNVTELGRFLAEEFSVALSEWGKGFDVVDRTHLKSLLKEHELALTGLIDPKTTRKIGEIAGVHALITGTITPFGDSIRLAVKVLATSTAKVIGASRGDIPKTKAIEDLIQRGILTGEPTPGMAAPTAPAMKPQWVEAMDFVFELQSCRQSGQTVTCSLLVTNKGDDREITLGYSCFYSPKARIFDDSGNEYCATSITFHKNLYI